MKKTVLLLLLANLALFGYGYYRFVNATSTVESERYKPLNAENLKLLTSQQISKLGPAKVAQLNLACAEWGPMTESDATKAKQLLEPLGLGRTLTTRRVEVSAEHWIHIPAKANKAAAERALAELKRLGVSDAAIISEPGKWQWAISLGAFRSKALADQRIEQVRQQGVRTAAYVARAQTLAMISLLLREPQQTTVQKLEELKAQIEGSSVVTGNCPETR